jgi:hypothetical protein
MMVEHDCVHRAGRLKLSAWISLTFVIVTCYERVLKAATIKNDSFPAKHMTVSDFVAEFGICRYLKQVGAAMTPK